MIETKTKIVLSTRARNLLLPNKMIKEKIATAMGVTLHTIQRWLNQNDPLITQAAALKVIREETGLTDDLILIEVAA